MRHQRRQPADLGVDRTFVRTKAPDLAHDHGHVRRVQIGAQLRAFPRPVLEACLKAANELYGELAQKSANFKRIYASWNRFRSEQFLWFRIAEASYDNFVFAATGAAAPARKKK